MKGNLMGACGTCRREQNATKSVFFDVLLTVHLSIFISVSNQLDAQNLFHNKFYLMPLHDTRVCVMQF